MEGAVRSGEAAAEAVGALWPASSKAPAPLPG